MHENCEMAESLMSVSSGIYSSIPRITINDKTRCRTLEIEHSGPCPKDYNIQFLEDLKLFYH